MHGRTGIARLLLMRRITAEGWAVADAVSAAGISKRTACKWLARYKSDGEAALEDASSAPKHSLRKLSAEAVASIRQLRLERMSGPAIARRLNMPRSTVGCALGQQSPWLRLNNLLDI